MKTFYQLFDDKKKEKIEKKEPVLPAMTMEENDGKYFKEKNELGYGIYFSVNEFEGNRRKESLRGLRYAYCDVDIAKSGDSQTREQKEALKKVMKKELIKHCEPTMIIDTSNGLQPLWELTDKEPTESNVERYVDILKGIRDWTVTKGSAGDNIYDVSRVVRLPGYNHMKKEPYLCELVHYSKKKYSLDQLERLFPNEEKKIVYTPSISETNETNPIFRLIDEIDFRELIVGAFATMGRPVTFDESGCMIDPQGGTTGTFIGRKGNRDYLASSSHEPYEGNRITATARILKITNSEAYKWICDQYRLNEQVVDDKKKELKEKYKYVCKEPSQEKRFTWGTEQLNRSFAVTEQGDFVVCASPSGAGKTTFTFFMARQNAKDGNKTLYLSMEMDTEKMISGLSRKRAGITPGEKYYFETPDHKEKIYEEEKKKLKSIKNFELKGIRRHGASNDWGHLEEIIIKSNPDIVFIDNLDAIATENGESDVERQNRIVQNAMHFTSATNIVVVLIHHFRKKSAGVKGQGLDDMRGSGKIRDGADRIITIRRNQDQEAEYPEKYRSTVSMDKGRDYDECAKNIYFIRGEFMDEPPTEEQYLGKYAEAKARNNIFTINDKEL